MADIEQPELCAHHPKPGDRTDLPCATCGHHILLHIGVEYCPVCELVYLNQRARKASVTFDQVVRGEKSINDYRTAHGLPPFRLAALTVSVEGDAPTEAALRRIVEKQAQRGGPGRT